LLTFVAGAAGRALRIVAKTDSVLARIGKGGVRASSVFSQSNVSSL